MKFIEGPQLRRSVGLLQGHRTSCGRRTSLKLELRSVHARSCMIRVIKRTVYMSGTRENGGSKGVVERKAPSELLMQK